MATTQQWKDTLDRKTKELAKVKLPSSVDANDFTQFRNFLDQMCNVYASKGISRFLAEKLAPQFDHIRSFTSAVNAAAQSNMYASLVWAGLQAVLECGCRFAESLSQTFELLQQLHDALPHFQDYISLYTSNSALQDGLVWLYEDYIDFCAAAAKFVSKGPLRNIVRTLWSSSYRREIKKISASIKRHRQIFDTRATLASRKKDQDDHAAIIAHVSGVSAFRATASFPLWSVPLMRNPKWFEREEAIKNLHAALTQSSGHPDPASCVVHGMGGVGKTQVVLEYVYRYRALHDCTFWLPAEDSVSLSRAFGSIGRQLGFFPSTQNIGQPELEIVQEWLKYTDKSWLMVFDNVEDWESIAKFWPTVARTKGTVIVTCQRPAELLPWASSKVAVAHFDVDTGSRFLLSQLGISNPTEEQSAHAREVCQLIDGLAVFLTHIGGHIIQSQASLEEWLKKFHKSSNNWHGRHGGANWMYERAVSAVFDVALSELSTNAQHVVYVLAFLSPDGVPETLLFPRNVADRGEYLRFTDDAELLDITADLHKRQLVHRERPDNPFLVIHRSLQEGLLQKLNEDVEQRTMAFKCALAVVRKIIPRSSVLLQAEPEKWTRMEPHLSQLLSLRRAFARSHPRITGLYEFAELLYDVGMNTWDRGLHKEALDVLRTAEEVLDAVSYPAQTAIRANLHLIISEIIDIGISGRMEAMQRRKKAYEIRQHIFDSKAEEDRLPEDEILLYAGLENMLNSYQQNNEFDRIERDLGTLYAKYVEWGGVDVIPYEYAKYYHRLAFVRQYQNDTAHAVQYAKRAAALAEQTDPKALMTNEYKLHWALMLYQDGQADLSVAEVKKIVVYREATCGRFNALTLQSKLALGILRIHRSEWNEACVCLRELLTPSAISILAIETVIRTKYYLSKAMLGRAQPFDLMDAQALRSEAEANMKRLLAQNPPRSGQVQPEEAAAYDYLVGAFMRVSTFRKAPPHSVARHIRSVKSLRTIRATPQRESSFSQSLTHLPLSAETVSGAQVQDILLSLPDVPHGLRPLEMAFGGYLAICDLWIWKLSSDQACAVEVAKSVLVADLRSAYKVYHISLFCARSIVLGNIIQTNILPLYRIISISFEMPLVTENNTSPSGSSMAKPKAVNRNPAGRAQPWKAIVGEDLATGKGKAVTSDPFETGASHEWHTQTL